MPKKTKAKSKEEKLAQDRLQKKLKYAEIKKDPEKYAIQKEKERLRYLKRKEQKSIKSVKDMTPRHLRAQRKKWRENAKRHYEKKKKEKTIQYMQLDDSVPVNISEQQLQVEQDPLEGPSYIATKNQHSTCEECVRKDKILNRNRYRYKKEIGLMKQRIEKLQNEKEAVRKRLLRVMKENKCLKSEKLSTGKKIDIILEEIDKEKRDIVKKQLVFGEILSKNVEKGFKTLGNRGKHELSNIILKGKEDFKKHKLLTKMSSFTLRNKKKNQRFKDEKIKQQVKEFFEDDTITRIAPDKKEYVTVDKVKRQKRYLTDTLRNLYKKFLTTHNIDISYTTFCRYRPLWVMFPRDSNRNTCACKIHVNMDLLIQCLHTNKIIKETNGTGVLEAMCCDINNEDCMSRNCRTCKNKTINYLTFRNDQKIKYEQWCTSIEKYFVKQEEKLKKVSTKTKLYDFPRNIVKKFEDSVDRYVNHCSNVLSQYKSLKLLKATIAPQEAVIHVDFSENYCVKFNEEIQSFHFGGSRNQLSLHTCVIYLIDPEVGIQREYSFCTISESTQHDASAVWAHIVPVITYVLEISSNINTIHFISDSPTSQYRNRYVFYMISQLYHDFPQLKLISWNYLEAGHGKGAPDGIGAVLKRTADQLVRFGHDVESLEQFLTIRNRTNIEIRVLQHSDILHRNFPLHIKPVKGTMLMHQIIWSFGCRKMSVRKLSCFLCPCDKICSHGKHITFIEVDNDYVSTHQLEQFLDENTNPEQICLDLCKNLNDSDKTTNDRPHSPKIKILSDIRIDDWTNFSFFKSKDNLITKRGGFHEEFNSFLNDSSKINTEGNKKKKTDKKIVIEKENKRDRNIFWDLEVSDDD